MTSIAIGMMNSKARATGGASRRLCGQRSETTLRNNEFPTSIIFAKAIVYGAWIAGHGTKCVTSGTVAVVEAYTDVIAVHQRAAKCCRDLGTSFNVRHARKLWALRGDAEHIVLIFDSETSRGARAAERGYWKFVLPGAST
jgi:DNA primase